MSTLPSSDQVRSLPTSGSQHVSDDFIDENGHMNIGDYFDLGSWAPWKRLAELGMDEHYIPTRRLSFFTVENHIRYLGELRLGQPFSVHSGFVGRTPKALHAVAYVLDDTRDRVACAMEVLYVHVSMDTRRAAPIPDDLAAAIDAEMAAHPWVPELATVLSVRR